MPKRLLDRLSDEQLLAAVRRGEEAAFAALFDRYHRPLLTFCRHMLSSREDAEDVVQSTFGAAIREVRESDRRTINFRGWLYTVARNRCINILRARHETPTDGLEPISTAGLSEEVERRAELRHLIADLKDLPEKERAALLLFEAGDLSHPEIAEVLGCETQQVKAYVFQARSSLIASREAREIPCLEIRHQLATATNGELRRAWLKRHLRQCDGCRGFAEDVRRQRRALALALPAIPSLGLKQSALGAAGLGGGGSGAGGAGGGGLVASLGGSGAAKALATGLAAAGLVGGVTALEAALPGSARAGDGGARDSLALGQPGDGEGKQASVAPPGRPFGAASSGSSAGAARPERADDAQERGERSRRAKASSRRNRRSDDQADSARRAGASSGGSPRRTRRSRGDRLAAVRRRAAAATAALDRVGGSVRERANEVTSTVDGHARRAVDTVDEGVRAVVKR